MAYWVHAYCPTEAVPTIHSLMTWLREQAEFANAQVLNEPSESLDSTAWDSFELSYDPAKPSLAVECLRNTGPDSLCAGMAEGELESLEDLADTDGKRRVAACLAQTQFIICCTVSRDPDHREGFRVRSILDFYVDSCSAILDTEDEGFYAVSDTPLLGRCVE